MLLWDLNVIPMVMGIGAAFTLFFVGCIGYLVGCCGICSKRLIYL